MNARVCLPVVLALAAAAPAWAQFGRNREAPRGERVEAMGTIEGMAAGAFRVKTMTGENWVFRVAPNSRIRIVGHAQPDFLKPGMFIQFTGQVDKRGTEVAGEIAKLVIFTPYPQKMPGAFPESMFAEGAAPQGEQKPAFPAPPAGGEAPANLEGQTLVIGGQITSIKSGGRVTMSVPNLGPKVRVQIAETAEIDVDVAEPSIVRPGSRIDLIGTAFQPGMGLITEATIELPEMLTGSAKRKPAPGAPAATDTEEEKASEEKDSDADES